jgi:hypothetical protein
MDSQLATPELSLQANELEDYFESISDSFESTWAATQRRDFVDYLLIASFFLAFFSVLPGIPMILTGVVQSRYPTWHTSVAGMAVPIQSFFFWWGACIVLSIPLVTLAAKVDAARSKRALKEQPGPASMRFALCYATVKELERYAKNGLQKHVERAQDYWAQLQQMIQKMLCGFGSGGARSALNPSYSAYSAYYSGGTARLAAKDSFAESGDFLIPSLFPEMYYVQQGFPWFKLEPTTSKIINALCVMPWKITTRLMDRKDLSSIASSLLHLASFLYTLIPEVSSAGRHSSMELVAIGERYLLQFADSLEGLNVYKSEPQPLEGKEKVRSKLALAITWFGTLFVHESPVVKFIVWWALALAIVIFGLIIARHYATDLKMDSTIVTLLIATPLLVGAAALAGPFRKR